MSRYGDKNIKEYIWDSLDTICYEHFDKGLDYLSDEEKIKFISATLIVLHDIGVGYDDLF